MVITPYVARQAVLIADKSAVLRAQFLLNPCGRDGHAATIRHRKDNIMPGNPGVFREAKPLTPNNSIGIGQRRIPAEGPKSPSIYASDRAAAQKLCRKQMRTSGHQQKTAWSSDKGAFDPAHGPNQTAAMRATDKGGRAGPPPGW
jgi:hypothetical protein